MLDKATIKNFSKRLLGLNNYYNFLDIVKMRKIKAQNNDLYNKIISNKQIMLSHCNERCFILGNGPSLKTVDLSVLKEEFTFTVNYFPLCERFQDINMNAHVLIDGAFFGIRNDMKGSSELIFENYERLSKTKSVCFVPASSYDFINKKKLSDKIVFRYINGYRDILDKKLLRSELNRSLYSSTNVVLYAIQIAVSMGFSKIYLLGCDTTNVLALLNTARGIEIENVHFYNKNKDDSYNTNKQVIKNWSISDIMYDQYILFKGYDQLKKYCELESVDLINCTKNSLLINLPYMDFLDVLKTDR